MPRPSPRRFTHPLALAAALTAARAVHGEVLPGEEPLDFGLHLTRLKTDLHAPGSDDTARIRQIGISAFDRTVSIQPGMLLGYAWINLEHGPTAALAPEGYYIGLAVRAQLWQSARSTVTVTASYLYQRVHDNSSAQAVTLQWYQPQLDLDLLGHLTRFLCVRVGATYGRADAEERATGTVNQRTSVARDTVLGGRAGLELDLGDRGQIGFTLHQAVSDGVELYFQRQY